jgi:hypothetical protein
MKNEITTPHIPPDDLSRSATLAKPDEDNQLLHLGLVGDTYTILQVAFVMKAQNLAPKFKTELLRP